MGDPGRGQQQVMLAAEACLVAMESDGRAWPCDRDALARVRRAMMAGAGRGDRLCALRAAEASLTEMYRDRRSTPADVAALAMLRGDLSREAGLREDKMADSGETADKFELGQIVRDFKDPSGLRGIVMRGGMSWCAYVGAPNEHPMHGLEELRFPCHFGINFTAQGEDTLSLPHGFFWWGWDYAHFSDMPAVPPEMQELTNRVIGKRRLKVWTADEVGQHVLDALTSLRQSIERDRDLAERVLRQSLTGRQGD